MEQNLKPLNLSDYRRYREIIKRFGLWPSFVQRRLEDQKREGRTGALRGPASRELTLEFYGRCQAIRYEQLEREGKAPERVTQIELREDGTHRIIGREACGTPVEPPALAAFQKGSGKRGWRETGEWLYEHLDDLLVTEEDAPRGGAWQHLVGLRATPESKQVFREWWMERNMPTQKQIDAEARLSDDGRDIMELIGVVQRARKAAGLVDGGA